jgi:hypothetical protein
MEDTKRGGLGWIRMEAREETPTVGKKKVPERREIEEEEWNSPKDLCVNSENCRDLSIKNNFSSI